MPSKLIVLSTLFLLTTTTTHPVAAADRPNIVLVMADDQGWGDMAYNGHPVLKTPNFDAAAAAGLRFDRFYAAAPVCSPTRASVMTGRHPNRMGVFKWGYPMRPQEVTLAEALKTVGYTTGHFGKWHLGSVRSNSPAHPGNNGFDEWLSAPNFYDNDAVLSRRGKAVQMRGESSMIAVDAALQWMKQKAGGDQPFLSVVWFGSPHSPHRAAEEDRELYDDHPRNSQHFYGEITGMDRAFGKLRDSLTELGIRDNTILWYCSDNGALPKVGSTGGHRGNKGKVYEGGLLVPAILEWPARIPKPRTTNMRCNTCDIYPTLLEIAGVTIDNQPPLDGISLVSSIDNHSDKRSRAMGFWDYSTRGISTPSAKWMGDLFEAQQSGGDLEPHESSRRAAELPNPKYSTTEFPGHAAWIDGNWKLHRIHGKNGKVNWELYDLAADPAEKADLAAAESERVEQLRGKLDTWLASVARSLNGEDYTQRAASAKTKVRVAAVSFVPGKFELQKNAKRLEQLFREAAKGGAKLAVAPEGALEGYVVNEIIAGKANDEEMNKVAITIDHPIMQRFQRLAKELDMCLVFGLAERIEEDVFNCAVFIGNDGEICGKYHKMQFAEGYHPSWWFNRLGKQSRAFDTPFGRCGLMICNDRWNPTLARIPVLDGAQFLVIPSFGSRSKAQDEAVLSRGRENGVPVVEANVGVTLVVDGDRITKVDRQEEGITFGHITIPATTTPKLAERDRLEQEFLRWREEEMQRRCKRTLDRLKKKH